MRLCMCKRKGFTMTYGEVQTYLRNHGYYMTQSQLWLAFGVADNYRKSEVDAFLRTA